MQLRVVPVRSLLVVVLANFLGNCLSPVRGLFNRLLWSGLGLHSGLVGNSLLGGLLLGSFLFSGFLGLLGSFFSFFPGFFGLDISNFLLSGLELLEEISDSGLPLLGASLGGSLLGISDLDSDIVLDSESVVLLLRGNLLEGSSALLLLLSPGSLLCGKLLEDSGGGILDLEVSFGSELQFESSSLLLALLHLLGGLLDGNSSIAKDFLGGNLDSDLEIELGLDGNLVLQFKLLLDSSFLLFLQPLDSPGSDLESDASSLARVLVLLLNGNASGIDDDGGIGGGRLGALCFADVLELFELGLESQIVGSSSSPEGTDVEESASSAILLAGLATSGLIEAACFASSSADLPGSQSDVESANARLSGSSGLLSLSLSSFADLGGAFLDIDEDGGWESQINVSVHIEATELQGKLVDKRSFCELELSVDLGSPQGESISDASSVSSGSSLSEGLGNSSGQLGVSLSAGESEFVVEFEHLLVVSLSGFHVSSHLLLGGIDAADFASSAEISLLGILSLAGSSASLSSADSSGSEPEEVLSEAGGSALSSSDETQELSSSLARNGAGSGVGNSEAVLNVESSGGLGLVELLHLAGFEDPLVNDSRFCGSNSRWEVNLESEIGHSCTIASSEARESLSGLLLALFISLVGLVHGDRGGDGDLGESKSLSLGAFDSASLLEFEGGSVEGGELSLSFPLHETNSVVDSRLAVVSASEAMVHVGASLVASSLANSRGSSQDVVLSGASLGAGPLVGLSGEQISLGLALGQADIEDVLVSSATSVLGGVLGDLGFLGVLGLDEGEVNDQQVFLGEGEVLLDLQSD